MTIPAARSQGAATPYPATLNVAGVTGTITKLAVRLNGLTHTYRGDLDMLLVGPGGQRAMFMSDVGNSCDTSGTSLTITFEDGALAPTATQIVSGTFAPTDLEPGDVMSAPAPPAPTRRRCRCSTARTPMARGISSSWTTRAGMSAR